MTAGWVAASVRARSMAQLRLGATRSRRLAAAPDLAGALALLRDTGYGKHLSGAATLAAAQRATNESLLWRLRVLAGWLPPGGAGLVRAVAAVFERDNILALARRRAGGPEPAVYDLGALATAWPRLRDQSSVLALSEALTRSAWGPTGALDSVALRDVLTLSWLRRLVTAAPAAAGWARSAGTLLAARMVLVDHTAPTTRVLELARPWLGRDWAGTHDLPRFRASLPGPSRAVLAQVHAPDELWRAEARVKADVETEALRLVRAALPGPDVVLGAAVALAVDGWRVRAGLAAAETGRGSSEVLDAMA